MDHYSKLFLSIRKQIMLDDLDQLVLKFVPLLWREAVYKLFVMSVIVTIIYPEK